MQRRTVRVLVGGQVLAGIGIASGVSVGALVAADVLGRRDLAGLVQTAQILGAALIALPAAGVSARLGRGPGLALALATGAAGAVLCVVAATTGVFPLLLLGSGLLGGATAAGLQARFAGTDLARADERGRALAVVLWATTVGAVLGPNLVGPAAALGRAVGVPELAGPYLVSAAMLAAAAALVLRGLRPDPLALAGGRSGTADARPSLRRGLALARRSPGVGVAILTAVVAHSVMVAVMVMSPVHMDDGGATIVVIGLVISGHVAGMYALSPVMGWAADRVGRLPVAAAGAVTLAVASALAALTAPGSSPLLALALVLLGLGWSACLVAAGALLADATAVTDRALAQGTSDTVMNLGAALAGAVAGVVISRAGFDALAWGAAALAAGWAGALAVVGRRTPHDARRILHR